MTTDDLTSAEQRADGGDGEGWCLVCASPQDGYPCMHTAAEWRDAYKHLRKRARVALKSANPSGDPWKCPAFAALYEVACHGGPPPSAPTGEPPPKRDIWKLAEEAQREVDAWPEWKRRAADQALVTTGEPDATEGPAPEEADAWPASARREVQRGRVSGRRFWVAGCDCVQCRANRFEPVGAGAGLHLSSEPPEPDEDRTKPPPSYEVFSVDEDEPPTGPPVWGWIVNRESHADHGEWFGTAAEAVADAWRDYDKFTAPLRARAETAERERDNWEREARACAREAERRKEERDEARERAAAVERERDTLRALLKRCDATLRPFTPLDCGTLLTDIRTALHQPKE